MGIYIPNNTQQMYVQHLQLSFRLLVHTPIPPPDVDHLNNNNNSNSIILTSIPNLKNQRPNFPTFSD